MVFLSNDNDDKVPSAQQTLRLFDLSVSTLPQPDSPAQCFYRDTRNLVSNLNLVLSTLQTFWTEHPTDELCLTPPDSLSLIYFTICSLVQAPFILFALVAVLVASYLIDLISTVNSVVFWRVIQGPPIAVYPTALSSLGTFNETQRWVYINGVATGRVIMKQNLKYISELFGVPVLGINNRTYGMVGDLLECIVQRAFNYHTKETRIAKTVIKKYLLAETSQVSKVILIAHSQGGIFASHLVDDLLMDCDLSVNELAKLEIYTFGSAAQHMNNPYADATRSHRKIPVMEHYCNEHDMVTSWGAVSSSVYGVIDNNQNSSEPVPNNLDRSLANRAMTGTIGRSIKYPFMGKVFVRRGAPGHMLNQHYLRRMFNYNQSQISQPGDQNPESDQSREFEIYLESTVIRLPTESALDTDARYCVYPRKADKARGEQSVQDVSGLWKYLKTPPVSLTSVEDTAVAAISNSTPASMTASSIKIVDIDTDSGK